MKTVSLLAAGAASCSAFTSPSNAPPPRPTFVLRSTTEAEAKPFYASDAASSTTSDFASAVPEKPDLYAQLGWKEEDVSVGIKPEDILQYIGTRADLLAKIKSDNPSFSAEQLEEETDRFILDPEMVDFYIEYLKRKEANPAGTAVLGDAESGATDFSDPSTIATYGLWIAGGAGFASLKNFYLENPDNQFVANLPHPDWLFHSPAAEGTVSAVGDALGHTVDPAGVQSVVEGVSGAVSDALTKCVGDVCP
eukprot:CAMPEP_0113532504 /NCGR_PEP_ID=MMETSP0015_2-20120614/4096_1 /TAXON_ID=2838 /ORGANISM="Odontella" /LENGTH=250 /DNA_ID=CAMNT_0000431473 /DNA_START=298 /DNA_END=1050 /DNA_ORIENTATION=+ /assembly_acc=CAM_ASM_000160